MNLATRETLLVFALFVAFAIPSALGQSITAGEAKDHLGEHATVCGKVVSEKTATASHGKPTFINLDAPYPKQVFTILIWGEDRQSIGALPADGSHVCATGRILDYRGVPEIIVKSKEQLSK